MSDNNQSLHSIMIVKEGKNFPDALNTSNILNNK